MHLIDWLLDGPDKGGLQCRLSVMNDCIKLKLRFDEYSLGSLKSEVLHQVKSMVPSTDSQMTSTLRLYEEPCNI